MAVELTQRLEKGQLWGQVLIGTRMEKDTSNTIHLLESITKWPTTASTLLGLWPFSIQNHHLTFKWRSREVLLCLISLSAIIISTGLVRALLNYGFSQLFEIENRRPVERFGYGMYIFVQFFGTCALAVVNLCQRKRITSLWSTLNNVTDQIVDLSLIALHKGKVNDIVLKFSKRSKRLTLFALIMSILQSFGGATYLPRFYAKVGPYVTAYVGTIIIIRLFLMYTYLFFLILLISSIDTLTAAFKLLSLQLLTTSNPLPSTERSIIVMRAIQLSHDLENTVAVMNKRFKVQIIIGLSLVVVSLTLTAFLGVLNLQLGSLGGLGVMKNIAEIFVYGFLLYAFCSTGESFTSQASKFGVALSHIDSTQLLPSCQMKVQMESLRIQMKPATISPDHFFTINNNLLSSIVAVLTTYFIVLMQFDHSDNRVTPTGAHQCFCNGTATNA